MDAAHLPPQGVSEQTATEKSGSSHLLLVRPDRGGQDSRAGIGSVSADLRPSVRAVWLARVHLLSRVGLSAFVVAVLVLHGVRADLNPAEHTISEYSLGSYGWVMRLAFLTLAVAALAAAASFLLRRGPHGRWRLVGPLLLVGTAVGSILDAAFNTDHLAVPETVDGTVHSVGTAVLVLALPGAAFVLGSDFVRNSTSTLTARLVLVVAAAELGAIVLFEMSPTTTRGWAERLVTVFAVVTLGLLQVLSRTGGRAVERGRPLQHSSAGPVSSVFRRPRRLTPP